MDGTTVIPTAGGLFGDVRIELVQGEAATEPPRLLVWDGKRTKITRRFVRDGLIYVPTQLDPTIASAIRLPVGAIGYGSTRELFTDLSGLISHATHLGDPE